MPLPGVDKFLLPSSLILFCLFLVPFFRKKNVEVVSFNLGVGIGAVLLLAKCKYEFDKTIQLQKHMITLLKDIKGKVQMKDVGSNSPKKDDCLAYPSSNSDRYEGTKNYLPVENGRPSNNWAEMQCAMKRNQESNFGLTSKGSRSVGRDVESSEQLSIEMVAENIAPPARSFRARSGKEYDTQQACSKESHGVCPNEVERRLHELLQRRQQERIAELEYELEYAKHKVSEKEMEVCWWKEQCTTPFAGLTGSEMFSR